MHHCFVGVSTDDEVLFCFDRTVSRRPPGCTGTQNGVHPCLRLAVRLVGILPVSCRVLTMTLVRVDMNNGSQCGSHGNGNVMENVQQVTEYRFTCMLMIHVITNQNDDILTTDILAAILLHDKHLFQRPALLQ